MNIYAEHGDKVKFSVPDAGYSYNREQCKKHLELGKVYTIDYTEVISYHTDVYLVEIPGIAFNSVNFEDAK